MKIPFLSLSIPDRTERENLLKAVDKVLAHGQLINGPELEQLESRVSNFCGKRYAVGVNSGTDALFLALRSLGIGSGDEVITTSLSWIATANAIALTNATPVFADIRDDLNLDPESVKERISERTRAILPVHYTGKICDMENLLDIAERNRLFVIEDAAQAFGSEKGGRKAGAFGDLACYSMNPMKIFAACGEAGIIVTDRKDLYDRLLSLRYNGTVMKERCIEPSLNCRMDTLQAAILLSRYDNVPDNIARRREIASWYNHLLADIVETPTEKEDEYDSYYTYTIKTNERDLLKEYLASHGIESKIQHPILMPGQPAYNTAKPVYCPNAERLVKKILSLPASEKITKTEVEYVAACVKAFFEKASFRDLAESSG